MFRLDDGWATLCGGAIDDPASAELSVGIAKNYYKTRWVPYYRPLDKTRAPHAPTGWLSWNTYFDGGEIIGDIHQQQGESMSSEKLIVRKNHVYLFNRQEE